MTRVTVATESTLNRITSFGAKERVNDVKLVSELNDTPDKVGFSDPAIVSVTVGGKLDNVSFQTSITIDPAWSAVKYQESIEQENGIVISPFTPVEITEPPPSIVIPKVLISRKYDAVSAYDADTDGTGGAHDADVANDALSAYDALGGKVILYHAIY